MMVVRLLQRLRKRGFSIVEVMVAVAILGLLLVLLLQMIHYASTSTQRLKEKAQAYERARTVFDIISRSLSQATLATEYDYYNAARMARLDITNATDLSNFIPANYGRYSSLHFVSGKSLLPGTNHTHAIFFQAPLDFSSNASLAFLPSSGLMNAIGFYIEKTDDAVRGPLGMENLSGRVRYRLMMYLQPTENLDVYRDDSQLEWFRRDLAEHSHELAENIVALAILPKYPDDMGRPAGALAPDYEYNTRTNWTGQPQPVQMHQLPPVVRVFMAAIDERTAERLPDLGDSFRELFTDPEEFNANVKTVEDTLREAGAYYHLFQTDVPVRTAKWSEE